MRKIATLLRTIIILLIILSCTKQDEIIYTTVRKLYPIEGDYKGTRTLICDSLNMNIVVDLTLSIRAKDGEFLYIENNQEVITKAQYIQSGLYYSYLPFDFDYSPCSVCIARLFGGGKLEGDTLTETGWFIKNGYHGKWNSKLTKQ